MSEPRCQVGDLVRISQEPWNQFAGELVVITSVTKQDDSYLYEWVIPVRRGCTSNENFIEKVILGHGYFADALKSGAFK